ncbi:hypothetical protein G3R48_11510 [Shewanella intestini]|uniref:Uncharacterized protein n=1 Tax=Shewanella intestini TaxID=2017544 RepID=A0ABS5I3J5_9GAMM|nr:hypothetical protein [Shewanella intestini]MBR9728603.1 hypothetical protein [Shewanella intestini]
MNAKLQYVRRYGVKMGSNTHYRLWRRSLNAISESLSLFSYYDMNESICDKDFFDDHEALIYNTF